MSFAVTAFSVATVAVTPFVGRHLESAIAKSRHSVIPRSAEVYPPILKLLRGADTNTTPGGIIVFGAATLLSFAVLRKVAFGSMHRNLARQIMCYPGTNKQIPIKTFKQFVASLGPAISSNSLNLSAAMVLGFTAKGLVEGPGRFSKWGPRPYDARLAEVLKPKISHYTSGDNHH